MVALSRNCSGSLGPICLLACWMVGSGCSERRELIASLPGGGAGGAAPDGSVDLSVSCGEPVHVVSENLNPEQDDRVDLLVAAGQCLVQFNNLSDGSFEPVVVVAGEPVGETVATGQLDDGDQEGFADAISVPNLLRLYQNDGRQLSSAQTLGESAHGQPGGLVIADLAGDANNDVAIITAAGNMRVWIGDGQGNLASGPMFGIGTGGGRTLYAIAPAQGAGDSALDLLMVDDFGPAVLPNEGDLFRRAVYTAYPPAETQRFVVGADFNQDGCTDAFTFDGGPEQTGSAVTGHYFLNECDASGNLVERAQFSLPQAVFALSTLWNDDALPDLLVAQAAPENRVSLLLGTTKAEGFVPGGSLEVPGNPRSIAVADFDNSGSPDLAVALRDLGVVRVVFDSL